MGLQKIERKLLFFPFLAFLCTQVSKCDFESVKMKRQPFYSDALLSREAIWINVLTQKRYAVHIDRCDIWNDLRPFLKYFAQPFSRKLRSKEVKWLKSGNLGKENFSFSTNFLLDSILFLCTTVNFLLKVA